MKNKHADTVSYDTLTHHATERQAFQTGAVRDVAEGKGSYELISPIALRRLAKVLELGASRYGNRNWEKGIPLSRHMQSGIRHMYKYLEGHRDEDHLGCAMCNIMFAIHTEEMIAKGALPHALADLPDYVKISGNTASPVPLSQCCLGKTELPCKPECQYRVGACDRPPAICTVCNNPEKCRDGCSMGR